ncbi:MAG: 1-deoxy-D-xylulose-5-phosphate synthase [Kiritimatiellia bacterium]
MKNLSEPLEHASSISTGKKSRIMYIECKFGENNLEGDARIGRVFFSKTGRTLYYRDLELQSLKGAGFKANYYDVNTGDHYWVSGPKKDQNDRLYGGNLGVEIDDDVQDEYQTLIQKANNSRH